jgi:hypothetical protein
VEADAVTYVATIESIVPDADGELSLHLELADAPGRGSILASNRYTTTVEQAHRGGVASQP